MKAPCQLSLLSSNQVVAFDIGYLSPASGTGASGLFVAGHSTNLGSASAQLVDHVLAEPAGRACHEDHRRYDRRRRRNVQSSPTLAEPTLHPDGVAAHEPRGAAAGMVRIGG